MIVERTLHVGECLVVLTNHDIFEAISEDGATFDDLKVDVLKDIWLKITDDDLLVGVVQFKRVFNMCFESHIHILKEHRKKYSKESAIKILDWCHEFIPGATLYANVPEFCQNVKMFLLRNGFKETGILPNAWLKNGELHNMNILSRGV